VLKHNCVRSSSPCHEEDQKTHRFGRMEGNTVFPSTREERGETKKSREEVFLAGHQCLVKTRGGKVTHLARQSWGEGRFSLPMKKGEGEGVMRAHRGGRRVRVSRLQKRKKENAERLGSLYFYARHGGKELSATILRKATSPHLSAGKKRGEGASRAGGGGTDKGKDRAMISANPCRIVISSGREEGGGNR